MSATPRLQGHWLTPDRGRPLLGWDLPGHGDGESFDEAFTIEDLAGAVVTLVDRVRPRASFVHAGVSVAGAVGLALAVGRALSDRAHDPARVRASAVICSGAHLGSPEGWAERAELVRRAGTPVMVEGSRQRWFAPGFVERQPRTATALLTTLQHADRNSYARVCEALARADLRDELSSVEVPVMVMGGRHDPVVDPEAQEQLASSISASTLVIVEDAAHLAPAECPGEVGEVLASWITGLG